MYTPDKSRLLETPFLSEEHGFLQGNPYILKDAIRQRLSKADPHWTNTKPSLEAITNDVVLMTGGLTLFGDTRYGMGTGVIISTKKDPKTGEVHPVEPYQLARETAKAMKTAQSDLLPRCALEFGVGAYLKNKPKDVTQANFEGWLKSIGAKYHWANNGGGERFKNQAKSLNLSWTDHVAEKLEPGRVLTGLTDIHLTEEQAIDRLSRIVGELRDEE